MGVIALFLIFRQSFENRSKHDHTARRACEKRDETPPPHARGSLVQPPEMSLKSRLGDKQVSLISDTIREFTMLLMVALLIFSHVKR